MTEPHALDEISADRFREHQNQIFRVPLEDGFLELELTEVRGLKGDTPRQDRAPYSILFRGPSDIRLEQQTLALENKSMGQLVLFLVPLGPDPDDEESRMLYEAIFT